MARRIELYDCNRCPLSLPAHALAAHAEMHNRRDREAFGDTTEERNPNHV